MEEKDYASEIFETLTFDDSNFTITDFKSRIKNDDSFLSNVYNTLDSIDDTFIQRMEGESDEDKFKTFETRILNFEKSSKKDGEEENIEVKSQFDVEDDAFDTKEYDQYLELLQKPNQTIAKDENGEPLVGDKLAKKIAEVQAERKEFVGLMSGSGGNDRLTAAKLLKNIEIETQATDEEINEKITQKKESLKNANLLQQSGGKYVGSSLIYALANKEENQDLINRSLPIDSNKKRWKDISYNKLAKKWYGEKYDPNNAATWKLKPLSNNESRKGSDSTTWAKQASRKSNELTKNFLDQYQDMVIDIKKTGKKTTTNKDDAVASLGTDNELIYLPSIQEVTKNPELVKDINISPELLDLTSRMSATSLISEEKLDSKKVRDTIDEALETFEDKQGVGAWNNVVNLVSSAPQFIIQKKIAEKLFNTTADEVLGMENSREDYQKNKKDLGRLLELSNKTSDYEANVILNNIEGQSVNILAQAAKLNDLKKKIENDPNATQKDVDQFNSIKNSVILAEKNIKADMEFLGNIQFEGNNAQAIIDKTQKTYNVLEIHENILANSAVRIVTGLGAVLNEVSNPLNVLEHVGFDLKDDDTVKAISDFSYDVFGETGGDAVNLAMDVANFADETADDLLKKSSEFGEELLNRNRPAARFDEIDGIKAGMRWGTEMLTGQLLNTGLSIVVPGGGGLVLSALSESGNQMYDMKKRMEGEKWNLNEMKYIQDFKKEFGFNPLGDDETYKIQPEEINALQFYGTAGIYGIAEYASEKITLGNFKLGAKNLRKAFDLSKVAKKGSPISNKINQRWLNLKEGAKDFVKGVPGEAFGEGAVTLSQNAAEIYILGNKDVSMLDGFTESMVSGLVMSGTMQSPGLVAQTYQAFRGPDRNAKIAERGKEILRLSNTIKGYETQLAGLTPKTGAHDAIVKSKALVEKQMHDLAKEQLADQEKVRSEIMSLTKEDRQRLINGFNAEHKIRSEIDKINSDKNLDEKTAADLINKQLIELKAVEAVKNFTLSNAEWSADKGRAKKFADAYRAKNGTLGNVEMVVGDNNKQALDAGLEYVDSRTDLNDSEKLQVKELMKQQFEVADKASRGDATVNGMAFGDNLTIEVTNEDGSKGTKNINLPITFALNRNNSTVQSHEIGHHTLFKQFMENNPDAVGLVQDLESYVKKNYKEAYQNFLETKELYGEYDSKGDLSNPTLVAEESLARLSDFMRQNNLEADRTLYNKMFGRFQKFNDGSGQIKTGKDVFDMITSYNNSFETGELSGLTKSIAEGTAEISRKKKTIKKDSKPVSKSKLSLTKAERSELTDLTNEAPGPKGPDGKYKMTKAEFLQDKDRAFSKVYTAISQGKFDGLIIDKMATGQTIYDKSRENIIQETRDKLADHLMSFDPSKNDSLFAWMNSYIGRRVGDVTNKAKREKAKKPGVQVSTDQKLGEEGRTIGETIADDTNIEAGIDANIVEDTIDNMRTKLGIEKGGPIYNKVLDSVRKVLGTKLPEVSNKKFREDLKKAFDKELFKEIKKFIGTRANYETFLSENFQTVFNAISQSTANKRFRQFVEPLIDPATGKQARPDNNPLFRKKDVKRSEFMDYFLGSNVGASTKGTRKDALAGAIAQELAFDATMEVLEDPAVQNRIKDIYELQGLRQAENYTAVVGKNIDRVPGSKFSKTNKTNLQQYEVLNEINNLEQFLQGSNIINKIENGKDLSELIKSYISSKNQNVQEVLNLYSNTLLGIVEDSGKIKIKLPKAKSKAIAKTAYLFQADPGPQLLAEQADFKEIVTNYDLDAIDANTPEGKKELIDKIFFDKNSALINFLPESALTAGTLSNGGDNVNLGTPLSVKVKKRLQKNGLLNKPTETLREYKLIDGSTILNSDEDFVKKSVQLKIAPVGTFLFANALQVKNAIAEAKKRGNTFALETKIDDKGVETSKNIKEAVKRQGYSAKMQRELGTPKFTQEQINKRDGFKELIMSLNDAVQFDKAKFLPVVAGLLSSTSGSQNHFGRTGSIIEFGNTLNLKNVEEHTEPASDLMKFLLNRMAQDNVEQYIDPALESFFQGALPKVYDGMLKGVGPDGIKFDYIKNIPSQYVADVLLGLKPVWIRYFNSNVNSQVRIDENGDQHTGINPNVIILSNGNSIAKEFGLEVSKDLQTPGIIKIQQQLLFEIFDGQITSKIANEILKPHLALAKSQHEATQANEKSQSNSGVTPFSKTKTNKQTIEQANMMDKALDIARDPNAPVKKIRVFDFDDTLARTKSNVFYTMPDGTKGTLTAEEFAERGGEILNEGGEFDFSDFNIVRDGKPGPLLDVAKKIQAARGTEDVFVLTARAPESQAAIKEFLDSLGLNIPLKNITGLGNSTGAAKANWVVNKAAEGYNDFYFADDAIQNVQAVKDALSVIDVKSAVQQAKIKFSKTVDQTVNDIIEHKTGIKSEKEYSDVKARLVGRKKGKFKLFIPPSAEDFVGLLYSMLGKGEIGNMQMDFFNKHLIEPYGRAMENLSRDQNRMINDFKVLKEQLIKEGLIPKNLNKIAFGEFTHSDVARILAWNKQGMDIPGISKADLKQVLAFAKKNQAIDVFAQNLIDINKGDGYAAPTANWLAGTISTDLLDGLRTGKRSKYLQEWQDNIDLIFSPKNLNKMEAAFGTNWRDAMEDMISRMKSGRNRSNKMGKIENRLLDYINNSVGTVMFFNMRSALLQTISAVNFIDFGSNNIYNAGKAFANQTQYWKDFSELMNSEFLVERRNGLKLNVSESEIADAAATSKNKAKAAIAYILSKGYLPTQFADSFAIASGGATFYRNRINALMKEGMSEADAKKQAFLEFREIAEESQQSSRPDRVSQQQASTLGRLILAFQNTPMQMNRLGKKSFLDLINRRKRKGMTQFQSDVSNISRVTYYMAVQSMIFSALQQGLFALAFNEEEEEESENERYLNVANGMLNTVLNGTGIYGVALSTLISVGRKVYKESKKEGTFPGPNYEDAANEMLNFSPPIDIKLSKLRQAGLTWKYEGYKHDEAKWSIDDPAYKSAAYVISGLTNVPVDRLISKSENVRSALEDEQQTWKRISLLLGWKDYQLNSTEERKEYIDSQKEAKSAYRKRMKAKRDNEGQYSPKKLLTQKDIDVENKQKEVTKYKKLKKPRQVEILDSLGLSKKQIRALRYEKDRVAKLIELMKK